MGRFGKAYHRLRRQRLLMPQPKPIDPGHRLAAVEQIGSGAIANKEKIAEHLDRIALLAFSQERRHRNAEELTQKVKQRYFQRGDGMNGHALVESLQSASARIAISKAFAHRAEDVVVPPDRLADQQRPGLFQGLPNPLTAWHLTDAGAAGIVAKNHNVPCKKRRVRP